MTATEMPRLRDALTKLRAAAEGLAAAPPPGLVAQECLDFLAMVDGMKPVYLLGRGFADPAWVAGALAVAAELGLAAVEGPCWDAPAGGDDPPSWYVDHTSAELARFTVHYICRSAAAADEVRVVCRAGGRPAAVQEARLLDYPECCVAAHHMRNAAFHRATVAVLRRAAGGAEDTMRRLLREGAPGAPETDEECAALAAALTVVPCPFTSFNMCLPCCDNPNGPAARLSLRYAGLAQSIDPALAHEIAQAHADQGAQEDQINNINRKETS